MEHQMRKNGVQCVTEKTEGLPFIVGDNNGLQQVFINLLTNAIDALEHEGHENSLLTIRTYSSNGKVCVDFEDNGPGIPKEVQTRMFDPFFTTKSAEKGTGLGLAISQSILHKHDAQIEVESEEGSGTRFTISFPISSGE
jgi:signal transduction histidine kinase